MIGSVVLHSGAVSFFFVDLLYIKDSRFQNNISFKTGAAIQFNRANYTHIFNTTFINNFA